MKKTTQRSWLARAETVHDIGGMFYRPCGGEPRDDERDAHAQHRWDRALAMPLPTSQADTPYFGCRMHDSTVLGIDRTPSLLRLRLDSINAGDFAGHLASTLDLPHTEAVWPIDLLLHGPQYVRAAHADARGSLRFVDCKRLARPEFLYDWAFQQDGRIQWIAQLWRYNPRFSHDWQTVYFMVDAAQLTAEDRCAAVFSAVYGKAAARLYLDAIGGLDEKPIDFHVFDSQGETPAYIRRRMAVHGFIRADFLTGPNSTLP